MSLTGRNFDSTSLATATDGTLSDTQSASSITFLKNKLGISVLDKQKEKILETIATPADAITARYDAITGLVDEVEVPFRNSYNRYLQAGLDKSNASALAQNEAEQIFKVKLQGLRLTYPDLVNETALAKEQISGKAASNILKFLNI